MANVRTLLLLLLSILCYGLSAAMPQKPTNQFTKGEREDDKFAILQRNFDKLYNQLEETSAEVKATNAQVVQLHLQNDKLRSQLSQLQAQAPAKPNATEKHSSFLAIFTGGTVSLNEILRFREVKYNDAPDLFGYDPNSGVYRCPYNGTYAFLTNVVTQSLEGREGETSLTSVGVSIMKNGNYMVSSMVTTPPSPYSGLRSVLSAAGVTQCGPGDEVGVVMTFCQVPGGMDSGCIISGDYNGNTHFTGFKIY